MEVLRMAGLWRRPRWILGKMGFFFILWKSAEEDREREVKVREEDRKEEKVNGLNSPVDSQEEWNLINTWCERVFKVCVYKPVRRLSVTSWRHGKKQIIYTRPGGDDGDDPKKVAPWEFADTVEGLRLSRTWTWNLGQLHASPPKTGRPPWPQGYWAHLKGVLGLNFRSDAFSGKLANKVTIQSGLKSEVGFTLLEVLSIILVLKLYKLLYSLDNIACDSWKVWPPLTLSSRFFYIFTLWLKPELSLLMKSTFITA